LFAHRIDLNGAEQVFFNRYVITPNNKKHGPRKYRIEGPTDDGRSLRLIFEDLSQSVTRKLRKVAERKGDIGYQTLIKIWIAERLEKESAA
jgi:hypothetical protein